MRYFIIFYQCTTSIGWLDIRTNDKRMFNAKEIRGIIEEKIRERPILTGWKELNEEDYNNFIK